MPHERIRMPATMESFDPVRRFVLARTPTRVHKKVDLVLEELLLNVIHYAYAPSRTDCRSGRRGAWLDSARMDAAECPDLQKRDDQWLEVELEFLASEGAGNPGTAGEFLLRIRDWGQPFDPVQRARPDTSCSLEKRTLGGLGILLVRKMADSVNYRRDEDQNVVDVRFIMGSD
ncbi:ATP-binding protein [Oceanidesulfovibrio marinus]|uniref:ATP-binding protein n=1 Tax=Oceanidesulfovibrio marinus TaxID=370038 RepID=A0A6P1ZLJ9_9BACT|nr:ATP-binding protein [Oceanidesulfovibrio marinus]QJT09894.1 ATP-binding protein [Oceanidesulfovibrio marinus]TVM35989.1 hypothetical protein DQK91_04910 [Oceanidesulfovibrio marinus]